MAYTLEIKRWKKKQLDKINCISMFQSFHSNKFEVWCLYLAPTYHTSILLIMIKLSNNCVTYKIIAHTVQGNKYKLHL